MKNDIDKIEITEKKKSEGIDELNDNKSFFFNTIAKRIRETNCINKDKDRIIAYDIDREQFFDKNNKTGVMSHLSKPESLTRVIKEAVAEEFREFTGRSLKKADYDTIKYMLPTFLTNFDPHKDAIYEENGRKVINAFSDEGNNLLSYRKRRDPELKTDFRMLKEFPMIETLLESVTNSDKEMMKYVLNWIATGFITLQKTRVAILFKGATEGTGKGVLVENVLGKMYGKYLTIANSQILNKDWNNTLENRLFVSFNEVKTEYERSSASADRLKAYITDPSMIINVKQGGMYESNNFFNVILSSNNSAPIHISKEDRRFTVIPTATEKLDILVMRKFGISISDFIKELDAEVEPFVAQLVNYDYNQELASTAIRNDAKDAISSATSSRIEMLSDFLNRGDFEGLEMALIDAREFADNDYDLLSETGFKTLLREVSLEMSKGIISNKNLKILHNQLADTANTRENTKGAVLARKLKIYFGETCKGSIKIMEHKVTTYKRLKKKYDGPVFSYINKTSDVEEDLDDIYFK